MLRCDEDDHDVPSTWLSGSMSFLENDYDILGGSHEPRGTHADCINATKPLTSAGYASAALSANLTASLPSLLLRTYVISDADALPRERTRLCITSEAQSTRNATAQAKQRGRIIPLEFFLHFHPPRLGVRPSLSSRFADSLGLK